MTVRDFHAIDGKVPAPDARFDVVVVGAGPAGTAAAIAAAADGASVLLIDENPAITTGSLPSITATQLLVVPRSIPIILPMSL